MARVFRYTAVDSTGRRTHGSIEAASRDEAMLLLRRQKLTLTSLEDSYDAGVKSETPAFQSLLDFFGFTLVSHKSMAVFTRKFAGLINAGIIWSEIFEILAEETENRRLRNISEKVADDLRSGENIYNALSKYPNVFTKVYRSMIRAGEATGRLHHIMNQLADMYEQEHELRSQVMSKMYFPLIYLAVGLAIIGMVIFMVPRFFGPTANLFSPALFMNVVTIYLLIIVLILFARTKPGYAIFRSIIAYVPPFGGVLRKMSLARFSRLFAAMYSSGVPVMEGMDVAGETLMEPALTSGLEKVKKQVMRGEDLATALRQSNVFPRSLRGMVRTGEVSGSVDEMLNKAAEYYEIDIKSQSNMIAAVMTIGVYVLVLITLAIFVISAWSNYYGQIDELLEM